MLGCHTRAFIFGDVAGNTVAANNKFNFMSIFHNTLFVFVWVTGGKPSGRKVKQRQRRLGDDS